LTEHSVSVFPPHARLRATRTLELNRKGNESVAVLDRSSSLRLSSRLPWTACALAGSLVAVAAGCRHEPAPPAPEVRPVRTVTIAKRDAGVPVVLTGSIRAQDEAPLAFRVSGRMIERRVNNGDRVRPGQVIARLETQNEQNNLRGARANLSAAQGQLTNARNNLRRLEPLAARGAASQAELDQARESFQTAQSQVESGEAQVKFAEDQLAFTELKADADGVITSVGAEPGEVVSAGRMIVTLARQGARDAVFDVPAPVIRSAPKNPDVTVSLKDDPAVTVTGLVREVAPQADPVTRTFEVKVGLTDPPAAMRLGSTVVGRMDVDSSKVIDIPATALTQSNQQPAVWIVDPSTSTVSLRTIDVLRFDPDAVVVSKGLAPGDVVVTAGVQALYPGQKIRLLNSPS
jgi:RND family efflux transporter MFP subunit